jgi:hypothetical protein
MEIINHVDFLGTTINEMAIWTLPCRGIQ